MIGKLSGVLDSVEADHAVIDCNGVGYVTFCGSRTLGALPAPGTRVSLAIETVVREDSIRLYGFATAEERDWFRLLQSVQGVGAKVALAILSALSTADLARAVALQDKAAIGRAQGVGPKLAQRLVTELKDKAPAVAAAASLPAPVRGAARAPQGAPAEAVSALVNLGYGQTQAAAAIAAALAAEGEGAPLPALIRLGLKELAR